MINLDMNENYLSSIIESPNSELQRTYPRFEEERLLDAISKLHCVPKGNLFLTNGIDEGILLFLQFIQKNNKCLYLDSPNYCGVFEAIGALGINAKTKTNNRFNSYYETFKKRITEDNDIGAVYFCSPMNPIGAQIDKLADCVKLCLERKIIVFLDQAYAEFCDPSFQLAKALNDGCLIIGRTFSKAYGLAGIRCGYIATSNQPFLEYLSAIHQATPFRFSADTLHIAYNAINNQNRLKKAIHEIKNAKNDFYDFLDCIGLEYYKTETNFVPIKVGQHKACFLSFSEKNGMAFADLSTFKLPDYIRITIGTKKHMEKVCNIISMFFGEELRS